MWRFTLILNSLLMGVFSFLSSASLIRLRNSIDYNLFHGRPLPRISAFAISNTWIYSVVPLFWLVLLIVALKYLGKHSNRAEIVSLHTSATLFVGILMLSLFLLGGILPFIPMVLGSL